MGWIRYVVLAIAPLVLVWGIYSFMASNRSPLPNELVYVDVTTGEVMNIERGKVKTIPGRNDKGERVLFPAEVREGRIFVMERYKASLDALAGDSRLKVDMSTLEVKGAN
ncbi:MAG: hypothetical protein SFZ24_05595 [Planctomycetota bacterium]|nr:hypothetical protein [Planctomycetota bacterium]